MDWQQIIVFLIVATAAAYLWRRSVAGRKQSGCGGCGGCGSAKATATSPSRPEPELIQLDLGPRRPAHKP